ncbi:MAG: NifB/NifX family molybdenum-iron cluster-binding protein [Lachnospiraceae bacterium]|nr:NifB/NifX family molybdenum-iron cluster-binding protein [Lachnospiraceae bacterium]
MKIAIPVDEDQVTVCASFGRAPYYLFHDTETNTTEVLENPAASAEGGAGIKAAQFIVDQKSTSLITIRCGENAAEVLQAAEIKIFKSEGVKADENISALKEGKLAELTHFHAGYHGIR